MPEFPRMVAVTPASGFVAERLAARICVFCLFALCALRVSPADKHPVQVSTTTSSSISGCDIAPQIPSPPGAAKIFKRGADADDSGEIQKAINGLHAGDWLVFPPGTYTIGKHLTIPVDGVTLYGKGAAIHATNATDGALMIEGDDVAVYGLTLDQDSVSRQGAPWSGGISVFDNRAAKRRRVRGVIIAGNIINNSAAAGIFLYKASQFTVADNTVFRSWADGIHMTGGSENGRVIHNSVSQNGDDMIAVVSYAGTRKAEVAALKYQDMSADELDRNIYIAGNQLTDTYWGRGISVVGGSNVTIENNSISKTPTAAGIYLLRENFYATFGDHNILVRKNVIAQTQTSAPAYRPANIGTTYTHHGAIEVSSQMSAEESGNPRYRDALSVSAVAILDNTIRDARFAGVRIGAVSGADQTVSNIVVKGNSLDNVGIDSVAAIYPGLDQSTLVCNDNRLNGTLWTSRCANAGASATQGTSITGASLNCSPDGTLLGPARPKPPASLGSHM